MKENGRWPGFYLSRIQGTRVLIPTTEGGGVLLLFDQKLAVEPNPSTFEIIFTHGPFAVPAN